MKIRSAVLVACMLVVPALAMFSHRIPADVRAAARAGFDSLVARWAPFAEPAATVPPGKDVAVAAEVAVGPVTGTPIVDGPSGGELSAVTPAPAPLVDVAPAIAPPVTIASSPAIVAAGDAEAGLRAAGASAVECRPQTGTSGMHVASCRVGLDASGQLVRVFHASGPDAESAMRSLLADVLAWRERVASREPPAGGDGMPAAERRF